LEYGGVHTHLFSYYCIAIYRSSIEYGAQIFSPFNNQNFWLKIQRIQFRIIRTALGLRQSTPICVWMSEACEPPMKIRLDVLTSRYIYKCFSRRFNLVTRSLRRLEIDSRQAPSSKQVQLIKIIPTLKTYILQKHVLDTMHRSVVPSYSYDFWTFILLPEYYSFNYMTSKRARRENKNLQEITMVRTELLKKFQKFSLPLIGWNFNLHRWIQIRELPGGRCHLLPRIGARIKT